MPATSPEAIARRRETLRLRARAKAAERRAAKGLPPLPPKPIEATTHGAGRPAGVVMKQPTPKPAPDKLVAFKQQTAIQPPHVKVQHLPSPPLDRWNVSVPVVPIQQWGKRPFA